MKIKSLFLTIATLLFLFGGCNKDAFFGEEPDVNLKKANVPLSWKGEVCMIENEADRLSVHFGQPDGPVVPGVTLSKTAFLYGHMSHVGKLGEQSWMTGREGAYLDADAYSNGQIVIIAVYDVTAYTPTGDYCTFVSHIRIDATNGDNKIITGDYTMISGTGKYENVTSTGVISGVIPCWDMEGVFEYGD